MSLETAYILHPACRVREEAFGLLFYDSRGPRLLFAETGRLLTPEFFRGQESLHCRLLGCGAAELDRVGNLLGKLVTKGYLREQPLC
ncbi:MAG: mycofactocin biosynthesis chaperone MftB [Desulfuromonadales bacterium]|nr:mycofactocin biosynthesis chaperone MftB [Desulfuromonadales bacterium]